MSEEPEITDASAFTKGSHAKQIVFTIITFGLYPLYWTYKTAKQLDAGTNQDLTPILAFIPFANLLLFWQIATAAEAFTEQDREILFILFLFVGFLSWYWIQQGINEVASE
jgi:hypothetical protein